MFIHVDVKPCENMLKCERCWKCSHDVGKIKLHPDLCLRCAEVMELQFKGTEIYEKLQRWHEKHSPIKDMKATHTIGKDVRLDVVYMSEQEFVDMYRDKITFLKEEE